MEELAHVRIARRFTFSADDLSIAFRECDEAIACDAPGLAGSRL
jgi:hypothetical protein